MKTIEWLEKIATTNTSSEEDDKIMRFVLNGLGFTNANVVCGIVYLEGRGTLKSPPTSIQSIAKVLLSKMNGE